VVQISNLGKKTFNHEGRFMTTSLNPISIHHSRRPYHSCKGSLWRWKRDVK